MGLNVTEMDFRQYDPAVGRFFGIDALAESSYSSTPYHFTDNNPIFFSDPSGLKKLAPGNEGPMSPIIDMMWDATPENGSTFWVNNSIGGGGGGGFIFDGTITNFGDWGSNIGAGGGAGGTGNYAGSIGAGGMFYDSWMVGTHMMESFNLILNKKGQIQNVQALINHVQNGINNAFNGSGNFTNHSLTPWDMISNATGMLSAIPTVQSTWMYNSTGGNVRWTGVNGKYYVKSGLRMNGGYLRSMNIAKNASANLSKLGNGLTAVSLVATGVSTYNAVSAGTDNTSTWVGAGIAVGGAVLTVVGSPVIVTGAAIGGLVWGVGQIVAGDQINGWIDSNFGYEGGVLNQMGYTP